MTSGATVTGAVTVAVYTTVPPSVTLWVAVNVTVLVSVVSVTAVTAGVALTFSFSKSPPVVPVMVALTLPLSTYTVLRGASTVTLPSVAFLAMVMVSPLLRFTFISVPAGLVSLAV